MLRSACHHFDTPTQALFWARTYNWRFADWRDMDFATLAASHGPLCRHVDADVAATPPARATAPVRVPARSATGGGAADSTAGGSLATGPTHTAAPATAAAAVAAGGSLATGPAPTAAPAAAVAAEEEDVHMAVQGGV